MKSKKDVDTYIAQAPKEARSKLREMREVIKAIAPKAMEGISYGMPGYDKGRVAWFASMKGYIGLYLRPPIIDEHKKELAKYKTTKSAIHFPLDEKLPLTLIKKLLNARIKKNKVKQLKICSRGHEYAGSGPCSVCWPGKDILKRRSRIR